MLTVIRRARSLASKSLELQQDVEEDEIEKITNNIPEVENRLADLKVRLLMMNGCVPHEF